MIEKKFSILLLLCCFINCFLNDAIAYSPNVQDTITKTALAKAGHYIDLANNDCAQAYHYELLATQAYIEAGALNKAEALLESLYGIPLPAHLKKFKQQLDCDFIQKKHEQSKQTCIAPMTIDKPTTSACTSDKSRTKYPKHIALILPLSGPHQKSAQAIKEGFLAKHQEDLQPIQISLYDSTQSNHMQAIYSQAHADGADFIVGPLIKEDVLKMSQLNNLPMDIPILALNINPTIENVQTHFFQFALPPEKEAELIAKKAWADGYRQASVIVLDNEWGKRILTAFQKQWLTFGAEVKSTALITTKGDAQQKYTCAIKKLLAIQEKPQPQRRQDIDVIILACSPDVARQLKPLLNFYYAEKLPVYATSSIYEGKTNPQKDNDLNDIIFCDMPWMLSAHPTHRSRLYAMGRDAYTLSGLLKDNASIANLKNTPYQGATGSLQIDAYNRIQYELSWAKIKSGVPEPL